MVSGQWSECRARSAGGAAQGSGSCVSRETILIGNRGQGGECVGGRASADGLWQREWKLCFT